VGTVTGVTLANLVGNSVVEDIGGGRYITYAHLKPGSIPAWLHVGARLRPGDLIGRVGNSGNSSAPHLHFQVADSPEALDATGLPFVFASQLLEGNVPEGAEATFDKGGAVTVDPTGAGPRRGLMPARNGVFGYNLPSQ
jgi:murein DD-endopeptidase MepM/ murein hydrolase activator NlpD